MASVVSGLTPRALRFRLFETFRIASKFHPTHGFGALRLSRLLRIVNPGTGHYFLMR